MQGKPKIPGWFLCPITNELMHDPVIATDGVTYDLGSLQNWFEKYDVSPQTGKKISRELQHNLLLHQAIKDFRNQNAQIDATTNNIDDAVIRKKAILDEKLPKLKRKLTMEESIQNAEQIVQKSQSTVNVFLENQKARAQFLRKKAQELEEIGLDPEKLKSGINMATILTIVRDSWEQSWSRVQETIDLQRNENIELTNRLKTAQQRLETDKFERKKLIEGLASEIRTLKEKLHTETNNEASISKSGQKPKKQPQELSLEPEIPQTDESHQIVLKDTIGVLESFTKKIDMLSQENMFLKVENSKLRDRIAQQSKIQEDANQSVSQHSQADDNDNQISSESQEIRRILHNFIAELQQKLSDSDLEIQKLRQQSDKHMQKIEELNQKHHNLVKRRKLDKESVKSLFKEVEALAKTERR